jgi:hypothetical protein
VLALVFGRFVAGFLFWAFLDSRFWAFSYWAFCSRPSFLGVLVSDVLVPGVFVAGRFVPGRYRYWEL